MTKGPTIVLIIGAVLLFLSLVALVISIIVPLVNSHADWEEAMLGIIPSGGCSCMSLMILLGGAIWLLVARASRKTN